MIAPAALVAAPAAGAVVRTGSLVGRDALRSAQARTAQAVVPLDPAWSEEFDGSTLDLTRWSYRATGPRHDGILTPDAVSVGDGVLTIKTYTESGQHFSGMISTQRQGSVGFEQTYGYFEARVKFNSSPGQWSAFWLQSPTLGNPVGDPAAGGVEMDIAEHRVRCVAAPLPTPPSTCAAGNDISDRTQLALVWDGYGVDSRSAVKLSDPLAQLGNGSWHTWALRWTPTELTFYYDDDAIWSIDGPISRRSQYAVLSSEVGQFFAGAIPAAGYGSRETSTTAMQVDYVRVWASSPQGLPTAPLNTAGPVASGTPEVGQALACSPGSWTGNPAPTFGYEWIGDGAAIAGATASTYIVRSIDQGHALSCRVTATNAAGPVSALSNTLLVASAPPEAQPQTRSEPPAPPLAPLAPALPPAVTGSSSCDTISLLRVTPRGPSFRVRVQPHCRGKLSLKATATALIRGRRVAVVVRFATRRVSTGARTVVMSFARSPTVQRARRSRRRVPVALVITFVPEPQGLTQTLRRKLLLAAPGTSGPGQHGSPAAGLAVVCGDASRACTG